MKLLPWNTPISDCENLDFKQLHDDGRAKFVVKTSEGELFEIFLGGGTGPYLIVEEEHLTKYWSHKDRAGTGWTFIVEESDFPTSFPGIMDPDEYTHYVVAITGICLEVLSKKLPTIKLVT